MAPVGPGTHMGPALLLGDLARGQILSPLLASTIPASGGAPRPAGQRLGVPGP